ncbi:hypothetical protein ACFL3Q_16215 [Planctomycetota bacterium]
MRITEVATGQVVEKWSGPLWSHYIAWSPDGNQLAIGGRSGKPTGLWIYDRTTKKGCKLMDGTGGPTTGWSPDGSRFEFTAGFPYFEIWIIDIPEGSSLQKVLGGNAIIREHGQTLMDYYDEAIAAEPEFTEHYLCRVEQALWLYGEQGALAYLQDFELALSRCDFALDGLTWHIWSRYCWPSFGQCRTMSPLAILLAEKVGWRGIRGLAHYRAGHWEETVELTRPIVERSEADAIVCFLHAMSCWQLGQKEEARTSYARAMDWVDSNKPPLGAVWLQAEATLLLEMPETAILELRNDK